jgi:hypothetical protein
MATFAHNQDGSVIVTLAAPITLNGEKHDKVTIPALRGKHMRVCPFMAGQADVRIADLVEFAAEIVVPHGAVDEMTPSDAIQVGSEVALMLGKSRTTGSSASP